MSNNLNLSDDYIDVRDICARVDELIALIGDDQNLDEDDASELATLQSILSDLKGNGGDHKYEGDWYPVTLIDDTAFEEYARELVEDCGYVSKDMPSWIMIDWNATSRNVRMDYTPTEINGRTYWYR